MFWSREWYIGLWEIALTWTLDHWALGPNVLVRGPMVIVAFSVGPAAITISK